MKPTNLFKSLLLCLALVLCLILKAQNVSTEFADKINSVFEGIDLNRVPHHLLTDYAMEFVDLAAYDGVLRDTTYIQKGTYSAAYNTLLMSRTKRDVPDLVSPDAFYYAWQSARAPYTIALSGLYYEYSRFRESAHPEYITINDDKLFDKYVNGVWQNPYEQDQVFMMAAPITIYKYKNMKVILPEEIWFTNQEEEVQTIEINFNDGKGYQQMSMNEPVYVEYAKKGIYDWEYRLTLSNEDVLKARSKMIIGELVAPGIGTDHHLKRLPTEPCLNGVNGTLVNGFDQVEFQGTTPFEGASNSATIQIRYALEDINGDGIGDFSPACGVMTRPLIVAEGFESGLLGGENPLGDNDLRNFRFKARNFSLDLRGEIDQYDIIYINWDQGTDDLRRNAALLQDIIMWVNETKTTANQNMVLGQSMGGIIARYTLASMEQDDNAATEHDTSLYISHDAPHQGANIPVGVQYFARQMSNQFASTPLGGFDIPLGDGNEASIRDIRDLFNASGTKQLLSHYIIMTAMT
jgi:hypothetical protein